MTLLGTRCAQVGQLGGGKRDTQPPRLLESSPPEKSLNYISDEIILRFDEFVHVKDIANQLNVSPVLKTNPEVETEGKKIKIRLNKTELKPSTTYKLNFGSAIVDMHEGNVLKNFEFIFSTGPLIDTLKLKGTVTDAFTNQPAALITVGLYDNSDGRDSLPYRRGPDYLVKTNEEGKFAFSHLPFKTFEVYAISDKNKNNRYERESEKVAFLGPPLELTGDSSINLKLFPEEAAKIYIKKSQVLLPGLVQLVFSKKCRASVKTLNENENKRLFCPSVSGAIKDTLEIFYHHFSDTLPLVISYGEDKPGDTLQMILPKKYRNTGKAAPFNLNTTGNKLAINQALRLQFRQWMDTVTSPLPYLKIMGRKNKTLVQLRPSGRWLNEYTFECGNRFADSLTYTLHVDSLAFKNREGHYNDSVSYTFSTISPAEFGKLTLKLKVNRKQAYLVQLVNEQQQVLKQREISFSLSSSNAVTIDFTEVPPGACKVKLVYDNNQDGKWNSGDLLRKRLPEQVFISEKQIKILPDWEIEEEILVKDEFR